MMMKTPASESAMVDIGSNDRAIQWRITSYLEKFYIDYYESSEQPQNLLIQFWAATNKTTENGRRYCLLQTQNQPFDILVHNQKFTSYRNRSLSCDITVLDGGREDENQLGAVGRVFKSKMPEISTNIYYYGRHEYPLRDFALSCGIRASLALPVFEQTSGRPNGVLELVSTSHDFDSLMNHIHIPDSLSGLDKITRVRHPFRLNLVNIEIPESASEEINHVLTMMCQTFPVPLAQCWVVGKHKLWSLDHLMGSGKFALAVTNKATSKFQSVCWSKFKEACWQLCLGKDQGLVGKTFLSHKSYFCDDITQFSMTDYALAHYARSCGSIACFTICLHSSITGKRDFVLEIFLPEMDGNNRRIMLTALLKTMKEHFRTFVVASGEELGEELAVEVIVPFSHGELESVELGHSKRLAPHLEASENEEEAVPLVHCNMQLVVEDETQQEQDFLDVEKEDESGEESPTHCNESQSLSFQTRKSQPQQEVIETERVPIDVDPKDEQLMLKNATTKCNRIIVSAEDDETSVHLIQEISEGEKKNSAKDISFKSLSEHFGRPLNDAAKSFGLSRSKFKRICRDNGIQRWPSGKRRMGGDISSKRMKVNDKESTRSTFSCFNMPPLEDTARASVGNINQHLNKMNVKATYNGLTIRFELTDSSGIAELEDNVIERLHLERKKFSIKYQDDEGDWVLISCDKDLHLCMEISRSLMKTTIKMLVTPPITH